MKSISGYDEYFCDTSGDVFSLKRGKLRKLKQGKSKDGYFIVALCKDGKATTRNVHRLIAETFIENSSNEKKIVNHKDCNKLNNSVENLEWCSYSENAAHAVKNGKIKARPYFCSQNVKSKLTVEQVLTILTLKESGSKISSRELAKCFNVTKNAILGIRKHKNIGL